MKAYNYECPKCKFDGLTTQEKRELLDRKENPASFKKYDRIVKSDEGKITDIVQCPYCDGMIPDSSGTPRYNPMRTVGGPIGGLDILPNNADLTSNFVECYSTTLGRTIHDEAEMKSGYLEMWAPKVAKVDEPKLAEPLKTIRRPGRPPKEKSENAEV